MILAQLHDERSTRPLRTAWGLLLLALLLAAALPARAANLVFLDLEGQLASHARPDITEPRLALATLATPPEDQGLISALPPDTRVLDLQLAPDRVTVSFSKELLAEGLTEARLQNIFDQVRLTLRSLGLEQSVSIQVQGQSLNAWLPPAPDVTPAPKTTRAAEAQSPSLIARRSEAPATLTGTALAGKSISLSPGHGLFWNTTYWANPRGIYCAPLDREDYHMLEITKYLDIYLAQDGAVVKNYRCLDKNYGTYAPANHPFWHMAACYWTKQIGYPCSVYASATGDCTLGSGASESSDAISAGPRASNYDDTDAHIALHSNGLSGDCTGSGCPNGTCTYYDSSSTHAAYTGVSSNLAKTVNTAIVNSIRSSYGDSTWRNRGHLDANGGFAECRTPNRAAILIELAFHDTCDRDGLYLQDNFFRSLTMWSVYKGVCDHFGVAPTWGFYSCEIVSHTIPSSMAPGATTNVQVTVRNRGVLWNDAKGFKLGAVGDSDPFSATTRHVVGTEVDPNETRTFTIVLTAPTTPGTYTTDWQMLREAVAWFGPVVSRAIYVGYDTQPPTAPTGLTATSVSQTRINLGWLAGTDNIAVDAYRIYRNGTLYATATSTSYADTNCTLNTTYTYQVQSRDGAGNLSALGDPASATAFPRQEYILDNTDATYTGEWTPGTSAGDKYGADYRYDGVTATETSTATWRPTLESAGNYDVYVWYPAGSNRSTQAPYTVAYNGGSLTVAVNQTANGGQWNRIATARPFLAGTAGYVRLGNASPETGKSVMADAVRFYFVSTVETPPSIIAQPQTQTVGQGSNATFIVAASGTSPLSYFWRWNGAPMAGNTSALTLSNVQPASAGTYAVVVSNRLGSVTSAVATLTVALAPAITNQPVSQVVQPGASVLFTVGVAGTSPFTYQWRLNGAALAGATQPTLTLPNAQLSHAGTYSVAVSNSIGFALSSNATLALSIQPAITQAPESLTVVAGSNVVLRVTATGSTPLYYRWLWNGNNTAGTSTSYAMNNIQPVKSGSYQVIVSNEYGALTSAPAFLTVVTTPVITAQPVSQTNFAGRHVQLALEATGGALSFQWLRQGASLPDATSSNLLFAPATTNDSGLYAAWVSNLAGVVLSSNAWLRIQTPLRFHPISFASGHRPRLTLEAEPGIPYAIEHSTNLTRWDLLTNQFNTNGTFEVEDGSAPNGPQRFYRALGQP